MREEIERQIDRELNGGSSWAFSDWLVSRREVENCKPVDKEWATSGIIVVGWLLDCKFEAGVSSGDAGLDDIFEGEEIGARKVTTELMEKSNSEDVKGWKSSSGSEKTERQSSEGGKIECGVAE